MTAILISTIIIGVFATLWFIWKQIQLTNVLEQIPSIETNRVPITIIVCTKLILTLLYLIIALLVLLNL